MRLSSRRVLSLAPRAITPGFYRRSGDAPLSVNFGSVEPSLIDPVVDILQRALHSPGGSGNRECLSCHRVHCPNLRLLYLLVEHIFVTTNMTTKRLYSQTRKQRRTSPGSAIARPLVEWLNKARAEGTDNWQAGQSLERVLFLLVAINKYTQQRSALNRALKTKAATREMVLRVADSQFDLHNELTAMLARYSFVATVDLPGALRFRGRFDADSFSCPVTGVPEGFREVDAVLSVFQLAQQKYISNVRLCRGKKCLRFFYASKRHHKFCSTSCRSHYWNATDEAKEARRVAAKERRQRERDENRTYWNKKKSEGRQKPKRRPHR